MGSHRAQIGRHQLLVVSILIVIVSNNLVKLQDAKEPDLFVPTGSDVDVDGYVIDHNLEGMIDEEELSKEEELLKDSSSSKPGKLSDLFTSQCSYGFFICNNGECISPKWRCDGHYDCDDQSDELNCTSHPSSPSLSTPSFSTTTSRPLIVRPPITPHREEVSEFTSDQEPLMLFSTGTSIRGYWMKTRLYFDVVTKGPRPLKTESPSITQALSIFFDMLSLDRTSLTPQKSDETVAKSRSTIVGVDMDPNNKEVFWVELGKDPGVYKTVIDSDQFEVRHRRQHGSNYQAIVDSGLLAPEDIALDVLGKNVYITDAGLPAIVVCHVKHSHCKKIVKDGLHKPRAIIVDPSTGWLTYTDWGDTPGIYQVTMDGKRRETLIDTDVVWPNGLAADYASNQLYWADARLRKIERVDLATKERREIIKEAATNPFSLSLFENRIYWSDWSGSDIRTCDKNNGSHHKLIMHADNIYGIHVYHPSIYSHSVDQVNPCWSRRCSHLCLLAPTQNKFDDRKKGSVKGQCACPESMALSVGDRATCYEVQLSFLLINTKNYVAQIFPERIGLHIVEKIIHSKDNIIHDIASDWIHYRLFFFDAAKKSIYLVDLSRGNKNAELELLLSTASQSLRGLLYDTWSDNVYWLDYDLGTLNLGSVKGKFSKVIRKELERPMSIVLDSRNRVFYIAMLGKISVPHIIRTDIHGNEQSDVVIISSDIVLPMAMHFDEQKQRLYWADAKRESIESIDLDVSNHKTGVKAGSRIYHRGGLGTILGFSVYHEHFLWILKNGDYLYKAKIGDRNEDSRPVSLKLPDGSISKGQGEDYKRIILVDPINEVANSPCEKRGCSHGCVLDTNRVAICICPNALELQQSNRSNCINPTHIEHPPTQPSEFKIIENNPYSSVRKESLSVEPETNATTGTSTASILVEPTDEEKGNKMVWLIVLLLLLSVTGLVTLVSLLILYKQGKLPRRVSQLTVSFISSNNNDKDGTMLLLD